MDGTPISEGTSKGRIEATDEVEGPAADDVEGHANPQSPGHPVAPAGKVRRQGR
jgi:hypothetical protein